MDNYSNEQELNNAICEAIGCGARATKKIDVSAGPQKMVCLLLCNRCVSKFEELDSPKSNTALCASYSLNGVKESVY